MKEIVENRILYLVEFWDCWAKETNERVKLIDKLIDLYYKKIRIKQIICIISSIELVHINT